MNTSVPYQFAANAVLSLHIAIVLFVVGGLLLTVAGNLRGWEWVNALWFRLTHLAAITFVVAEAWIGIVCPLTSLEMWLRTKAREAVYTEGFIEYWLQRLLYIEAPEWVFTLAYTLFGLAVVVTWRVFPPRSGRHRAETDA